MATSGIPNGHMKEATAQTPTTHSTSRPKRGGKKGRPNYALVHAKPLPLEIYPLPAFHPSHPLSLLHLTWTWLKQVLFQPSSHPLELYSGYFSYVTRSIHITDRKHVRALWEMGFFGKGSLSRSEPSWLEREGARIKAKREGGGTAEEATRKRREERRLFKLNRAREEAEKVERQRAKEEGRLDSFESREESLSALGQQDMPQSGEVQPSANVAEEEIQGQDLDIGELSREQPSPVGAIKLVRTRTDPPIILPAQGDDEVAANAALETVPHHEDEMQMLSIGDQEHLQLSLEEAFFLSYGLGVLKVHASPLPGEPLKAPYSTLDLLRECRRYSTFPPSAPIAFTPDDPFLLNYVVYHHFRSLGWVVRPGIKFSCDYLLYNRGPVFSHAEFAVIILPSYTHPFWRTEEGAKRSRRMAEKKDWWWLHCVNRVQSQVKKTLVLCYVDVPEPVDEAVDDIGTFFRRYKVREFVVRRWLANRSRE